MSELPREVQALLAQAREADQPSSEDRERVRAGLMASIAALPATGAGVAAASASETATSGAQSATQTSSAPGAMPGGWAAKWVTLATVAVLGGTALMLSPWPATQREQTAATEASAAASAPRAQPRPAQQATDAVAAPRATPELPAAVEHEPQPSAQPQPARVAVRAKPRPPAAESTPAAAATAPQSAPTTAATPAAATAAASTGSTASQPQASQIAPGSASARAELRVIQRATLALKRGELHAAQSALREHERLFPHGVLVEERVALRALATCRDGRGVEGRADAARFLARYPDSPLAERVRSACQGPDR
jgi:hypothetical protein